jgi:potassium-transporting ATPase KdpC subunit
LQIGCDTTRQNLKTKKMKKYFGPAVRLTLVMIVLLALCYPLLIAGVAKLLPGKGKGETVTLNGKVVGYALVGQKFTDDKFFWGRPSAVDYNAAGSAGSNKGPTNPDYLKLVQDRIDTFLVHNPGIQKSDIPAELVTASGSGLDPDISPAGALIQVKRIAAVRHLPESEVTKLVEQHIEKPFLGMFGPEKVNVLKLNVALEQVK